MEIDAAARCPCGTGLGYGECCRPFHRGDALAPTAERLMRSRYTAWVVHDGAYLLASWHRSTRPATIEFDPGTRWLRLEILGRSAGGLLDTTGTVEFDAHYTADAMRQVQHGNSRFVREEKSWLYVDEVSSVSRVTPP